MTKSGAIDAPANARCSRVVCRARPLGITPGVGACAMALGSVHYWAQQWICLSLLVGLGFWWFETAMHGRRMQVVPYVSLLVIGGLVIGLLQLAVLPDAVVDSIVGRQKTIYQTYSGNPGSAVSISLDREGTWYQIQLLTVALSGLLLGCRYFRGSRDIVLFLSVFTINGCLLSFFGILQKLTFNGRLYGVYEVPSSAFGPFINRNNAAGFLLLCLACCMGLWPIVMPKRRTSGPAQLVSKEMPFWRQFYFHALYFVAELTAKKIALLLATVLIASGIISTLSRGGVVALLVGGIGTLLIYGMARKPKNGVFVFLPLILMVALLTGWIGFSEQLMERFNRTDLTEVSGEGRLQNWKDTLPAVSEMGVLGAGLGSYRSVHRLYTTEHETGLYEFAENQFFQSLVEAGWPGLILFLLAWMLGFHYAFLLIYQGQSPTSIGVGTFGVFLLVSQAMASMFDFGLYVPANMFVMAVLVGFLAFHAHALSGRLKKTTWLRFELPDYLVQIMLLVLFAGLSVVGLDMHRRAQLDAAMDLPTAAFGPGFPDLAGTDLRIETVGSMIGRCHSVVAANYLAELWIHRFRTEYMDSLATQAEFKNTMLLMDEEQRSKYVSKVWSLTSLQRTQEQAYYLRANESALQSERFLDSPFIRGNLPIANQYFAYSRKTSPLQPVVQIRLGQINAVIGNPIEGGADIERGIELAPRNSDYRLIAGIYYLQQGEIVSAARHLHKYLELLPGQFKMLISMLRGKTDRRLELVKNRDIFESIIPDNPRMLFEFYRLWLQDDPEVAQAVLEKADLLLQDVAFSRVEDVVLRADVRLAQGEKELAVEDLFMALKSNPMDDPTQYRLANLLLELGRLDESLKEAKKLPILKPQNRAYNELVEKIENAIMDKEISDREAAKE